MVYGTCLCPVDQNEVLTSSGFAGSFSFTFLFFFSFIDLISLINNINIRF